MPLLSTWAGCLSYKQPFHIAEEVVRAARQAVPSFPQFFCGVRGCLPRALAKPTPTRTEPEAETGLQSKVAARLNQRQLSTTDILAPVTMKNAAKCDT